MNKLDAFLWGIWSAFLVTILLCCLFGNFVIDGISLTTGWHRWAIGIGCALWLAVIFHSLFWGGTA